MGHDKALLTLPGTDLLLWQCQLRTLHLLQPEKIFWSGPSRSGLPTDIHIIPDAIENMGPMAGVMSCLDLLQSDLLVVLAIDLPRISSSFLKNLLTRCTPQCGIVARHGNFFEPLAAIYPKKVCELARQQLRRGRGAMQDFVRVAMQHESLREFPLGEGDLPLFKNLNSPADLQD